MVDSRSGVPKHPTQASQDSGDSNLVGNLVRMKRKNLPQQCVCAVLNSSKNQGGRQSMGQSRGCNLTRAITARPEDHRFICLPTTGARQVCRHYSPPASLPAAAAAAAQIIGLDQPSRGLESRLSCFASRVSETGHGLMGLT
uniref:Uncharacterized protein n=1 Tax=Oryza glumipatula TaxID=40148 RepID=A0A0D9YFW5_9ORYZ